MQDGSVQGRAGERCCHLYYCSSSTCRVQSIHTHVVLLDGLYIMHILMSCAHCMSHSRAMYEYSVVLVLYEPRSG